MTNDQPKRKRGRPPGSKKAIKAVADKAVKVNLCVKNATQRAGLKKLGDSAWLQLKLEEAGF